MQSDVTVRDVMTRDFVGVSEGDDLLPTVELMLRENVESVVVVRGQEPVGILTERDVLALVVRGEPPEETTVADAMTASVQTVESDRSLDEAADRMAAADTRRVLVTETGDTVGLLTEHDLLSAATVESRQQQTRNSERLATNGGVEPAPAMDAERDATPADAAYSAQSICQECGALAEDLVDLDGQLVCADCREV